MRFGKKKLGEFAHLAGFVHSIFDFYFCVGTHLVFFVKKDGKLS